MSTMRQDFEVLASLTNRDVEGQFEEITGKTLAEALTNNTPRYPSARYPSALVETLVTALEQFSATHYLECPVSTWKPESTASRPLCLCGTDSAQLAIRRFEARGK